VLNQQRSGQLQYFTLIKKKTGLLCKTNRERKVQQSRSAIINNLWWEEHKRRRRNGKGKVGDKEGDILTYMSHKHVILPSTESSTFIKLSKWKMTSTSWRNWVKVNGNQMSGRAEFFFCSRRFWRGNSLQKRKVPFCNCKYMYVVLFC
jgi:hypothetical protein